MNGVAGIITIALIMASFASNASKVHYWKGEAEGEISTEAYFDSDSHGNDVTFVVFCNKATNTDIKGILSIRIDHEKHPDDKAIKSDALSFLKYKMLRAHDKAAMDKQEVISLCLNSKCNPHKWQYGDLDSDIGTDFSFKNTDEIRSVGIESDTTKNAIFAKVNMNDVMKKVCALQASKKREYSE